VEGYTPLGSFTTYKASGLTMDTYYPEQLMKEGKTDDYSTMPTTAFDVSSSSSSNISGSISKEKSSGNGDGSITMGSFVRVFGTAGWSSDSMNQEGVTFDLGVRGGYQLSGKMVEIVLGGNREIQLNSANLNDVEKGTSGFAENVKYKVANNTRTLEGKGSAFGGGEIAVGYRFNDTVVMKLAGILNIVRDGPEYTSSSTVVSLDADSLLKNEITSTSSGTATAAFNWDGSLMLGTQVQASNQVSFTVNLGVNYASAKTFEIKDAKTESVLTQTVQKVDPSATVEKAPKLFSANGTALKVGDAVAKENMGTVIGSKIQSTTIKLESQVMGVASIGVKFSG